jgi:alpha 1,2-mannosyltransferase
VQYPVSLTHMPQRWGDAPVHSIGVGLLARKDQIHFFDPIGYEHNPNQHCPKNQEVWTKARCRCNQDSSFGVYPPPSYSR